MDLTKKVWAKKEGYEPREFTMQQLDSLGEKHDGWVITDKPEDPEEVKAIKSAKAASKPAAKPAKKAAKSATKTKADNGTVHETKGATADGSEDPGSELDPATQGSEGDGEAN